MMGEEDILCRKIKEDLSHNVIIIYLKEVWETAT